MEILTTCEYCGSKFSYDKRGGPTRKYCSMSCRRASGAMGTYERHPDRFMQKHKDLIGSRFERKCAICGWVAIDGLIAPNGMAQHLRGNEIHHIQAVKNGGTNDPENLILLCPNHHKQADMGVITADQLREYWKKGKTEREQRLLNNSEARIAAAIFG